ncbi:alpha-1A adrenergic receptor-like [Strongylocentrotus purpuratus]|uniref:G-protein coupled receptors family 1 profile domain-containing protein n=1 Tax=Strongylocentrotus purpuratus TaxID=7668 RepID=A0A7M7RC21_STRPU|nr:alpha-1A adrenergic receptor-like [Strongylocentrotus purpuratus]
MSSVCDNSTVAFEFSVQGIIAAWIFATTSLLGIPGNILVIVAVALSQQLQTSTNIFVVALAVIDLLNCLLLPVQVMSLLGIGRSFAFDWTCTIDAVCMYVFLGISVSTLNLIAYNRFYMITKAGRDYTRLFTKTNMAAMLLGVGGTISTVTVVFAATGIAKFGHYEGICAHVEGKSYTYLSGVSLLTSLIVIVVCYVKIYKHVKRHLRHVVSIKDNSVSETVTIVALPSECPQARELREEPKPVNAGFAQRQRELETKITTNMLIVIVFFFLCVCPSILTLILPGDQQASAIIVAIIALNSCLNPLIYAWKHPVFRHVFKCIIGRKIREIKEPTQWARSLRRTVNVTDQ